MINDVNIGINEKTAGKWLLTIWDLPRLSQHVRNNNKQGNHEKRQNDKNNSSKIRNEKEDIEEEEEELKNEEVHYSIEDIADFIVGLLFAAHKNPSIASAQTIMNVLEYDNNNGSNHENKNQSHLLNRVMKEAIHVTNMVSNHESAITKTETETHDTNMNYIFTNALTQCPIIDKVALETLRITAHSIGAVRKVMCKDGWTIAVDHDDELLVHENHLDGGGSDERHGQEKDSKDVRMYTLPFGSYVGVSHIIPHRDIARW
eukprot:CAMPEP_0114342800 /NCGR_PEP_ID=MMETSP0101-20121206/10085_1 /TAXON_ID=38822 ORGANISM="Pteridomonas danica, Strain PT" /NCGR_SAMPLE_ID=MMETSP0101 /ASSEMBLY_ACC=CAM_ASM_000211 /LENGTH=259 /DNA_ID=CAMNT_0001477117 /DNA_START=308 /DNA_END=1084 /DNA_ORIENTATION=-